MKQFNDYLDIVFLHEGGYVNDAVDIGGATKYGISIRFLKSLNLVDSDIDRDGDVDIDDIKAITKTKASELYRKYFWDKLNLDGIKNEGLKLHIFDHAVNAGNKTAVIILQKILNVKQDGIIGEKTIAAINKLDEFIVPMYANDRKLYYQNLVIKNKKLSKYLKGWLNRVETTKF